MVYPIVYMDVLYVRISDGGHVQNRAVHVAIGVNMKEVLGLWTAAAEGAKFWLQVMTEIRNRGVKDVFITFVDGMKGVPEAIETVFPQALVQLCIVHLVRHSLSFVSWKQRRMVAADLRLIYTAPTEEAAQLAPVEFGRKWDARLPTISQVWDRNWQRITPFFAFPAEIRKIIYTAIPPTPSSRSIGVCGRLSGRGDRSPIRGCSISRNGITRRKWSTVQSWRETLNRFQILSPERMPSLVRA